MLLILMFNIYVCLICQVWLSPTRVPAHLPQPLVSLVDEDVCNTLMRRNAQEKRGRTCFVQFPLLRQNGLHGWTAHTPATEASEQEGGTVPREASRQRLKMTSVPQRVEWLTRLPRKPVAPNEGTVPGGVGLPGEHAQSLAISPV